MRDRGGFTLIEMVIVIAIASVFFIMAFSTITGMMRASSLQTTHNVMDRGANQVLQEVSDVLRPGVMPSTTLAKTGLTPFLNLLNGSVYGFGKHGEKWLNRLKAGTDFLVFSVPVDADGDGDTLAPMRTPSNAIADLELELGAVRPSGRVRAGAAYGENGARALKNDDSGEYCGLNDMLAAINPDDPDLALDSFSPDSARFADMLDDTALFGLGDGEWPSFTTIRFVPFLLDGAPVRIREEFAGTVSKDGTARVSDINGDGAYDAEFLLGNVEIHYGRGLAFRAGNNAVLLQVAGGGRTPLFQLAGFDANGNAVDPANPPSSYAIRISFIMCDWGGQQDPHIFRTLMPTAARKYEGLVELRSMSR